MYGADWGSNFQQKLALQGLKKITHLVATRKFFKTKRNNDKKQKKLNSTIQELNGKK